jgi:DnaK suppressor protein
MQHRGCVMRATDVERVRSWLQRRRRLILETSRRAAADIDELRGAQHVQELEESSQSEQAQHDLALLGEVAHRELTQIDTALERLEAGRYGICRSCGEEIDAGRVEVLPFVLDCAACAEDREEALRVARERELPGVGMQRG